MAVQEIHITSNGNFPLGSFLNGLFHVQISGDTGSGTIKIQSRNRVKRIDGSNEVFTDEIDRSTGTAFSFTTPGSFNYQVNGEPQINVSGGSNPDFYVTFREIKTLTI